MMRGQIKTTKGSAHRMRSKAQRMWTVAGCLSVGLAALCSTGHAQNIEQQLHQQIATSSMDSRPLHSFTQVADGYGLPPGVVRSGRGFSLGSGGGGGGGNWGHGGGHWGHHGGYYGGGYYGPGYYGSGPGFYGPGPGFYGVGPGFYANSYGPRFARQYNNWMWYPGMVPTTTVIITSVPRSRTVSSCSAMINGVYYMGQFYKGKCHINTIKHHNKKSKAHLNRL